MVVTLALIPTFSPEEKEKYSPPLDQVDAEDCSRWINRTETSDTSSLSLGRGLG